MPMTVFEIQHSNKGPNKHLSFIVICDKFTAGDFKTKEYGYEFAKIIFIFTHYADRNEIRVKLKVLPNNDEPENVYVTCNETNYAKRHIIAATYELGEARYSTNFNDDLIFFINIVVCDYKDKVPLKSKDTAFNFIISASDDNVLVHKVNICKGNNVVDIDTEGVTLRDLQGKINKVKTKGEIKLTEKGLTGKAAVLEYVDEKRAPELAAAILKTTIGFVVYNFVGMKDTKCKCKPSKVVDKNSSREDNPEYFVVIHQNVQSVNDKTTQLNQLNNAHKPDVLALSEVFHRKAEMEKVHLAGYELANCFCRTSVAHGGVALYTREGLQYAQRNDLQDIAEQVHFEVTAIEIKSLKLVAIALYRTGNGKFTAYLEKLELLLDKLTGENKRFLIVGDHNVHEVTEDNAKRRQRRKVEYVINSFGCVNTVKFKTRGDASLDCGFANHARNNLNAKPVEENISDHSAQVFKFTVDQWKQDRNTLESVERHLFNDGSLRLLYDDILVNIPKLDKKSLDVNEEFVKLFNVVQSYVNLHFPIQKKDTVPLVDEEMKGYLLECNGLIEVKRLYPNDRVVSDVIKDMTFEARQKQVMKKLEQFRKTDKTDKTEVLPDPSKYLIQNDVDSSSNKTAIPTFKLPHVTRKILDGTLQTILETALDTSDVSLSIVFSVWPALTHCLAILINFMFEIGVYPEVLSTITSEGDEDKEGSYKTISILPSVSKAVEYIIASHIVSHLDTNHLLANRHYSAGQRVSDTMTVHAIYDRVVTGLDNKRKMAGIFCDLSKAFNLVNHKLLLNKLYKYGIKDNALALVHSFIQGSSNSDRNGPNKGNFNFGVPQGSVLGQALFLLYVNDLPLSLDVGRCVLAPNGNVAIIMVHGDSYGDLQAEISEVFKDLSGWLLKNGLPMVNFEVMNFSCAAITKPPLENLPLCDKYDFIDFVLEANFSWKTHVDKLCDKLSSAVFALRKLKALVSKKALKQMYYKHFHLPMSYGTLVWGNSVDAENVLNIQKRALRTLEGVPADYNDTKRLFKKKKILTHYSQYLFELLTFARTNGITLESHRLKFAENNPRICGPTLYAKLPENLKNKSDDAFKKQLENLLLDNPLYSVIDFTKVVKKAKDTAPLP